jgi:hypothetical protein
LYNTNKEFSSIPEVIANLQANTVYWHECDQKQSQENEEVLSLLAVTAALQASAMSGGSSSHLLPRRKSIVDDDHIELE